MKSSLSVLAAGMSLLSHDFGVVAQTNQNGPNVTCKQAVLKAMDLSAGRGFYRTPVEVQVSRKDDTTTVVFRRPTSNRIASRGRKPTKTLCTMSFVGKDVVKEIVEEGDHDPAFDKAYSKKTDQDLARAARAACEYLWRHEEFKAKDFAVRASKDGVFYFVSVEHVPYIPDAVSVVELSATFEVVRQLMR
jgi:hypothetical protein